MRGAVAVAAMSLLSGISVAAGLARARRDRMLRTIGCGSSGGWTRRWRLPVRTRMVSASVAAGLIAFLVGGPALASLAIIAVVLAPWILRRRRARGEASALEAQLAHAVDAVSAALRAGLSLSQAIRYAAGECEPRVAQELRAVAEREDLGVPLDAALDQWEKGSPSDDVRLVANALRLRIGPGLPGVLDEVGRALRQRRAIAGEVRSLTAQARLSGTILGILPIGFFAFLALTSRHDMAAALATPAGIAAVVAGLVLQGGGYLWIRRLVRVETM